MTTRRLSAAALAAVLVLDFACASSAAAQTKCSVTDPLYPGAKTHFENGLKLEEQAAGDKSSHFVVEARDEFLIAYRACPLRAAAINLASIEVALKNPLRAMEYLRDAVRINGGPMRLDAETKAPALLRFDDAWTKAFAATAHANVEADADAHILVDGQELKSRAPLAVPVDLAPGPHTFEARLGNQSKQQKVDLAAGQETRVSLKSELAPSAPVIEAEGTDTNIKPYVVAGFAAVGALGVAGGFLFAAKAASNNSDAQGVRASLGPNAVCPFARSADCSRLTDLRNSKSHNSTIGIVSFVGGGVFVGAAIATALLWKPSKETSKSAVLVPSFGPGHVGLDLSARF